MSLKKSIFKNIISISIAILIVFSLLWAFFLYRYGVSCAESVIRLKNIAIRDLVKGYFVKIYTTVKFLSNNSKIKNAIYLGEKDKKEILKLFKSIENADPDITYVYAGYRNGMLLINDYTPPKNYNPVNRPWYTEAVKSYPLINNGLPYQEIKTGEWLISVSKAFKDKTNKIAGVIAIDSSLKKITSIMKRHDNKFNSIFSLIIKPDGKIIISPYYKFLGKNFFKIIGKKLDLTKRRGFFNYSFNGEEKIAFYSHITKLNWLPITVVDREEIMAPIFHKIFISILITLIILAFTGWYLTLSLTKKVIDPLTELKNRVKEISSGKEKSYRRIHSYPDDEIGSIIEEIEKLTHNEIYKKNIELQKINKQLELLSLTDQLTGLYNRRKLNEELEKEWIRAERYDTIFSVIIFDIDHFKKVNDTYGHQMGDVVLVEISRILKRRIRSTDVAGRWGGEEFLIICPETRLFGANMLANKIRLSVENFKFPIDRKITISAGVSQYHKGKSIEDIITEADEKLYKAKELGRNIVVS